MQPVPAEELVKLVEEWREQATLTASWGPPNGSFYHTTIGMFRRCANDLERLYAQDAVRDQLKASVEDTK